MEFQDVVRRRRSVRRYDLTRPVPPEVIERIVRNGLRAPSAGFSQGWGFLVLDGPGDVARFRDAVRPESDPQNWLAANVEAPLVIVALSNRAAYLDRYAQPDKGFTDRSDSWWPAPYWDIDTGFATLLMWLTATDAGLAASRASHAQATGADRAPRAVEPAVHRATVLAAAAPAGCR